MLMHNGWAEGACEESNAVDRKPREEWGLCSLICIHYIFFISPSFEFLFCVRCTCWHMDLTSLYPHTCLFLHNSGRSTLVVLVFMHLKNIYLEKTMDIIFDHVHLIQRV